MVSVEEVREKLRTVFDPELSLNIVDLGLVYNIEVYEENDVYVEMTLTTPGCPLHGSISDGAQAAVQSMEGVRNVRVNLVWNPPWNPDMMSDEAKRSLGRA